MGNMCFATVGADGEEKSISMEDFIRLYQVSCGDELKPIEPDETIEITGLEMAIFVNDVCKQLIESFLGEIQEGGEIWNFAVSIAEDVGKSTVETTAEELFRLIDKHCTLINMPREEFNRVLRDALSSGGGEAVREFLRKETGNPVYHSKSNQ